LKDYSLGDLIRSDVARELDPLRGRGFLVKLYVVIFSPALHVLYLYRVSRWLHGNLSRHRALWFACRPIFTLAYKMTSLLVNHFKGIEFPFGVEAGPGLHLVHPHSIILTAQTRLGRNCTIFNGVTCGVNHLDRSGYPVIGDDVVLFPGCKVVGKVHIGDTVLIGPNSVVVKDIESNSIAVGMPAAVIKRLDSLDALQW
jgi:serine O-acetyltransferase